jgi:hypothetical protein
LTYAASFNATQFTLSVRATNYRTATLASSSVCPGASAGPRVFAWSVLASGAAHVEMRR